MKEECIRAGVIGMGYQGPRYRFVEAVQEKMCSSVDVLSRSCTTCASRPDKPDPILDW